VSRKRRQSAKITAKSRKSVSVAPTPPPLPSWQALFTPMITHAFRELNIGVALWLEQDFWRPINPLHGVVAFEVEHGVEARRWAHNHRIFEQVKRRRCSVRAEHVGFHDLFVPVLQGGVLQAVVVAGPFAVARPTSADVLQRWFEITGSQGRLSDRSFAEYVAATLSTLTLEGDLAEAFERLLVCFAELVVGSTSYQALGAEAEALLTKLSKARDAERMWQEAGSMVSERTARGWTTRDVDEGLRYLGLRHLPEHAVVGLAVEANDKTDSVDGVLRRDAFLRACVTLARKQPGTISARLGDHGVGFLVDAAGSAASTRARLAELASRAALLARRFGLRLHVGVSSATGSAFLPMRYNAALWAAEKALSQGLAVVHGDPEPKRSAVQIRKIRAELSASVGESATLLAPRFERYIQAVLLHCGYRLEPVRAQLEAGIERIAEPLLASGAFDERGFEELNAAAERASQEAQTVMALVSSYRQLLSDIGNAIANPILARQDRSMRRALTFMREHLEAPLTLARVASVAGFAPDYFSRIFRRDEGVTFERYLQHLRVTRAKRMLAGTSLAIDGVGKLCGFKTRSHFFRTFKRIVRKTPLAYREAAASAVLG
jgi:AraC-like DNA-binding protein